MGGFLVSSAQGESLCDQTLPVWVGLLDVEGGGPDHVSVVEGGAHSVEGKGLSQANEGKSHKAGLKYKSSSIIFWL